MALIDNLSAYWKLDYNPTAVNGVSLIDSSGSGNALYNLFDSVFSGDGKINEGAYFYGSSILYSDGFGVDVNSNFSLSFWIKSVGTNYNDSQHIVGAPFTNGLFCGGISDNNGLRLALYNGSVIGLEAPNLSLDTWYHAVMVRSGDVLSAYLNGTSLGTADLSGQNYANDPIFFLGGGEYSEYFFEGNIDEVGIWTRAITPLEVASLYNDGSGNSYPFGSSPPPPPPPPVLGCTDPSATNYNPLATEDDGSCTYPPPPVFGCTDPTATNYNPLATQNDGSCVYTPPTIYGCTDPAATNYNPSATNNDGSCIYTPIVFGCTDPAANNYNPLATQDNGSCTYGPPPPPVVYGCTDPLATNYNPLATNNDGSCTYPPPPPPPPPLPSVPTAINAIPPSGWRYCINGTTIKAQTQYELYDLVAVYYVENDLPLEGLVDSVNAFLKTQLPQLMLKQICRQSWPECC
jgi:hypothetical protein